MVDVNVRAQRDNISSIDDIATRLSETLTLSIRSRPTFDIQAMLTRMGIPTIDTWKINEPICCWQCYRSTASAGYLAYTHPSYQAVRYICPQCFYFYIYSLFWTNDRYLICKRLPYYSTLLGITSSI